MGSMVKLCLRCAGPAQIESRVETFCNDCFIKFVDTKFRREMDLFRYTGGSPKRVLVAVSFGAGSIALVDLIENQLRQQKAKNGGKVGYEPIYLYIGDDEPEWPFESPLHRVSQSTAFSNISQINRQAYSEDSSLSLTRTSRQDFEFILLHRVIMDIMRAMRCESVVYGFTSTRLSELVLSETVKGRGGSVANLIKPRENKVYPLRAITSIEADFYLKARNLTHVRKQERSIPTVSKLQSIDELVHSYFAEVQKEFPAVISTVAKIATRLDYRDVECDVCGSHIDQENTNTLCHACKVMLGGEQVQMRRPKISDVLAEYEL